MADAPRARTVFVVEDDPLMLALLERCLRGWGYRVETDADGTSAWRRLEAGLAADVLLTDKNLPGMNGVALLGAARRRFPAMVGLMITADVTLASAREAIAAGALGFLVKPFDDLTDLRRELEGAVRRAHEGARAANLTAVSAALRRASGKRRKPAAVVAGAPSFDRDFLAQLLRDDGLTVTTASDAAAALAAADADTALVLVVAPFPGQEQLVQDVGTRTPATWVVVAGVAPAATPPENVIWIAA